MFGAFVPLAEERMSIEGLRVFSEQIQFFSATCLQVIMQSLLLFVWAGKRATTIPIWLVGAYVLILFGYERLACSKEGQRVRLHAGVSRRRHPASNFHIMQRQMISLGFISSFSSHLLFVFPAPNSSILFPYFVFFYLLILVQHLQP